MHWSSFSEFIAMGGYATYVWGSFVACVLLIAMEVLFLRIKNKRMMKSITEDGGEHE